MSLLTLINTVCRHIHKRATVPGCRPCSQLEMPDELESVLWRPRSPQQLSLWQTSSECVPSQSSPLTFIRDSVNVKPASNCSLICSVIRPLSLFKHSFKVSQSQGFIPDALSHSHLAPSYSLSPSWWMSSLDATLTCIWPLCLPLSCTLSFLPPSRALYTWSTVSNTANISHAHDLWL